MNINSLIEAYNMVGVLQEENNNLKALLKSALEIIGSLDCSCPAADCKICKCKDAKECKMFGFEWIHLNESERLLFESR